AAAGSSSTPPRTAAAAGARWRSAAAGPRRALTMRAARRRNGAASETKAGRHHPVPLPRGGGRGTAASVGARTKRRGGDEVLPAGPRSQPAVGRPQVVCRDHAGLLRVDFREVLAGAGKVFVLGELAVTVLIEGLEERLTPVERTLHLRLACVSRTLERALGRG